MQEDWHDVTPKTSFTIIVHQMKCPHLLREVKQH